MWFGFLMLLLPEASTPPVEPRFYRPRPAPSILAQQKRANPAGVSLLSPEQMAMDFAEEVGKKMGGSFEFKLAREVRLPAFRPGHLTLEPSHLSKQDPVGRFFVTLKALVDGRPAGMVRVDLESRWRGEVLRVTSQIARGEILSDSKTTLTSFEGIPPDGVLTHLPEGYIVRSHQRPGKILTWADVEGQPLVKNGEKVKLIASSGGLLVLTEVLARSSGKLGDRIRLENGRRVLFGVVSGPGEVKLEMNEAF